MLVWLAFFFFPKPNLVIWVLDVGQGDAILIRTPEGNTILIDGGPDQKTSSKLGEFLPFWNKTLDLVVISHWDADHISGLPKIFETYEVLSVLYPNFNCESIVCGKLKTLIEKENAKILEAEIGDSLKYGSTTLDIFWPPRVCNLDSNNCSVVFLLNSGRFEALFSGDIEERGQKRISEFLVLPEVEVFKVPHHGADCLDETFLDKLSPEISVISVGKNPYGHPIEATLGKLLSINNSKIYRTDQSGDVKIIFNGQRWWLD